MTKLFALAAAAALLAALPACTEDLTPGELADLADGEGTELASRRTVDTDPLATATLGLTECSVGKVLVCHIPPGNPGNAHNICISPSAVETHQDLHGDTLGGCVAEPLVAPVCLPFASECSSSEQCCSDACVWNECIDRI